MIVNSATKADMTYNIDDFINMRSSDEVTYYNYSILEYIDGNEYLISNLLYDYEDELVDLSVIATLTERQANKYRYKPWLLAYDLYGATECEFVIMTLNNIIDPKDFDFNKVRILKPNDLISVMGRIYSANETILNNNRSDIKTEIKNNSTGNTIW